ncbi:MAG: helix-turn-helix domain protein [Parcubacteria group bacterium]|nr:helix-turn-helix domain protein [Parcubacteria group bacterium]
MKTTMINGIEVVTKKELDRVLFSKPGFKEAYDELTPEYDLIHEIIRARIQDGVTQKALAEKIGTKQSAIARFERGDSNPTLEFMQKLARGLGLKLIITVQ